MEPGQEAPQLRTVAAGFLSVLRLLSREQPLLVALDDVQWLDPSSLAVFEFAFRRLEGEPVAVLAAVRVEPGGETSVAFAEVAEERLARLPVGGLKPQVVHALLSARLGLDLDRLVLRQLMDASAGNPFLALELGRALVRRGVPIGRGEPLPVPHTLHTLVADRLANLPTATRTLLLLAALAGDCTISLLTRVLGEDAWPHVRPALEAEVIVVDGDRVRFAHPLLASVTHTKADQAQRRDAHGRLAAAVADLEQRARHLALAAPGPDAAVARVLEDAARQAAGRGAPAAAAELAGLAAELTPPEEANARRSRLLTSAEFHLVAGQPALTRALLEPVVDSMPAGHERVRALVALGWTEPMGRGAEYFMRALAESDQAPALASAIRQLIGLVQLVGGDLPAAGALAAAAEADAERAGDTTALAFAIALRLVVDLAAGHEVAEAELERAVVLERAADADQRPRPPNPPTVVLGQLRMRMGRFDEAREAFAEAGQRAADRGDDDTVAAVLFYSVRLECRAGNWERAAELADRVQGVVELADVGHRSGIGEFARALPATLRGDASARALNEEAIAALTGAGITVWEIESRGMLGLLELSRGDAAAAVRELEPLPGRLRAMGYGEPTHLQAVPDLIEAYVELGQLDPARPLLDWYEQQATTLDHPLGLHQAARCRGLLTAAGGDFDGALAFFEAALASDLPEPFERARTLLARGIVLRRAKQRRDARESLDAALALFEQLGARLWAERAHSQLARVAGRRPAGTTLTATEQQVADLVAEGGSNKEVAAALFVTVKGVEAHLSHIYHKLGIHSRTELARLYPRKPS